MDCYGGRRRRYWCAARDSLVRAMEDHLRHLGRTGEQPLPVERVATWEVSSRNSGAKGCRGVLPGPNETPAVRKV